MRTPLTALLLSLLALSCSRCDKKTAAADAGPSVAPDAGTSAAAGPAPSKRVTVTLGSLSAEVPVAVPQTPFAAKAFSDTPPTIAWGTLDAGAATAPGWKYLAQLLDAKGTLAVLEKEGVAVDGNRAYDEFFQLYEQNRYRPLLISSEDVNSEDGFVIKRRFLTSLPSVVTADVVLHHLHLFFDYTLAEAETTRLLPELTALVDGLFAETLAQRAALTGTKWARAVDDNLVFLAVAHVFLASADLEVDDDGSEGSSVGVDTAEVARAFTQATRSATPTLLPKGLPEPLAARVTDEVARVLDATAVEKPGVYEYPGDFKEDYSMYSVRGHYLKRTRLQAYFRATMWLSRVLLSFDSELATRGATLLGLASSKGDLLARWRAIDEAVGFLVGPPDDASFRELLGAVAATPNLDDEAAFTALRERLAKLPKPQVQSVVTKTVKGPALEAQGAFHFFSQRAVLDAVIFQSLVEPQATQKTFVRALEVPAMFGSKLAATLLEPENLSRFDGYLTNRSRLESTMPKLLATRAPSEAVAGWMYSMQPLLEPVPAGLPPFMTGRAYETLRLSSYLAGYAELKHDTVLYAKQAVAEMGGPGFEDTEEAIDDRGYVVPEVAVYARAGVVLASLRAGLADRALFPPRLDKPFTRFEALVAKLEAISRKELAGKPLSPEDYHLIKFIGGDLEHFWEETLITGKDRDRWLLLDENNSRLIADVFTGPDGVQHVASGWVHPVYVVFPRDGKPAVGRGGVLSFYEVVAKERLSDPAWRAMLSGDARPKLPPWTRPVFVVDEKARLNRFDSMTGE
ncbi:MAG: DUF3160 domain-containing protein [Myxococcaceae bacterium]|nr:DUF3160 domain-containing protein [Myxococcaceae bacterium]